MSDYPDRSDEAERERLLLQDAYPEEVVYSGFICRFEIHSDPVDRILFEAFTQDGAVLTRMWFERDQYRQFLMLAMQVAHDAGFYDPGA
jgi:hypothetical protein